MPGHRFKPERAAKLIAPERFAMLPPEQIIKTFQIAKGDIIADLGCGNGFFTLPIAQATGEKVYALDIEPKMLEMLKVRAEAAQVSNIDLITSDLNEIKLPTASVDKLIAGFVIHEVPNLAKTFEELKRILKRGGIGIIIEWAAREMDMGPPLHERIPSEELMVKARAQGLDVRVHQLNDYNYALEIRGE